MRLTQSLLRPLLLAGLVSLAAGCGSNMDELDRYINEVKQKPGSGVEPLPDVTPYEIFTYTADVDGLRSPFRPDTPQVANSANSVNIDEDRVPDYLEQFPLDSLSMVGTLDIGGTSYGLVQDNEGLIHRVLPGNYVGQNIGRITDITEAEITIVEIISDGIGGYIERDAAISLSD